MIRGLGLAALALATSAGAGAHPAKDCAETGRNRALVAAFAHRFYDLRDVRGAFDRYVAPGYIQHNPAIADGRDAAIAALSPMFSGRNAHFEVKRIIVDGPYAVIHLHGTSDAGPGGAVADIYRIAHGRIVEHWDVLEPIAPATVNPHPYF